MGTDAVVMTRRSQVSTRTRIRVPSRINPEIENKKREVTKKERKQKKKRRRKPIT
ncbi:hypothetical protein [Rossellomorea vietnamensis]|uniref:hypothetical protein n=1 Tax=Rossellomorea vietnamensis TaxID=218284 RepID=UPI002078F285|nr:hypothetical protein [Rossellomorea vietnamensis]